MNVLTTIKTIAEAMAMPETQQSRSRMAVCKECPQRSRVFTVSQCKVCYCILELKTKHPTEHCPLGKW